MHVARNRSYILSCIYFIFLSFISCAEKKSAGFLKDFPVDGHNASEPQVEPKREVWSEESGLEQSEGVGIESSGHIDDVTSETEIYLPKHTVRENKNLEMTLDYNKPTEEIDHEFEDESEFDTIPLDNEQGTVIEEKTLAPAEAESISLEPNGQKEQAQGAEMAQNDIWAHQSQELYTNGSMENDKLSAQSTFPDQASEYVQPHVAPSNPVVRPSRHTGSEKVSDMMTELNKVALELLDSLAESRGKFSQLKASEERSKAQVPILDFVVCGLFFLRKKIRHACIVSCRISDVLNCIDQVQALSLELQEQYDALDEERSQKESDKSKLSLSSLAITQLVDAVAQLEHHLRVVQENIEHSKSLDSQVVGQYMIK